MPDQVGQNWEGTPPGRAGRDWLRRTCPPPDSGRGRGRSGGRRGRPERSSSGARSLPAPDGIGVGRPQKGPNLRISGGKTGLCPHQHPILRIYLWKRPGPCTKKACFAHGTGRLSSRQLQLPVLGAHRRNIRFPAAPAGNQCAGRGVWCRWQCLGAPPPPITIVGGCKTDDFESHGGSQNRPLAARLVWPHQATGVASRAVR